MKLQRVWLPPPDRPLRRTNFGRRRARHPNMLNKEDLGFGIMAVMCRRGHPVAVLMILGDPCHYLGVQPADHALVVEVRDMATGEQYMRSLSDFGMVPNAAGRWNQDCYLRPPSSTA